MDKVVLIVLLICLQFSSIVFSQSESNSNLDRTYLLAADMSFTPSRILNEKSTLYYIHGSFSFYPTSKISVRGDSAFSFREFIGNEISMRYHSTFFGACYHFTENGAFDPFIGIQPGISIFERSVFQSNSVPSKKEIIPNASLIVGLKFFVNNYFNFFGNLRYVYGQPAINPTVGSGLHEIRLSFGLGLNLTRKVYGNL